MGQSSHCARAPCAGGACVLHHLACRLDANCDCSTRRGVAWCAVRQSAGDARRPGQLDFPSCSHNIRGKPSRSIRPRSFRPDTDRVSLFQDRHDAALSVLSARPDTAPASRIQTCKRNQSAPLRQSAESGRCAYFRVSQRVKSVAGKARHDRRVVLSLRRRRQRDFERSKALGVPRDAKRATAIKCVSLFHLCAT
jgi:hypothetical protein